MATYKIWSRISDLLALLVVVGRYYGTVALRVRKHLRLWEIRARQIPDPALRDAALSKLRNEHWNAQAAAVFATLAPLRHRRHVVDLTVTFEIMYDFLDLVSEWDADDPVANGLQLHQALTAAIVAPSRGVDFYARGTLAGDGGYLRDLAAACRRYLAALPRGDALRPVMLAAVDRCGEGQTRTHAVAAAGREQLRAWAQTLADDRGRYEWWELAAGAASSLAMHALFAAAGSPRATMADGLRVEAAYFPSTCALSTLLDSLIDYEADLLSGGHCYVAYYPTTASAQARLAQIAIESTQAVRRLPQGARHAVLSAGVTGFYLSAIESEGIAAAASSAIVAAVSPVLVHPILWILRLKRR